MFFDKLWTRRETRSSQRASAVNSFRPGVESLEARDCPSVTAPTVQLQALSSTQVKVNWTDVAGESGYRVYQWNGSATVLAATVGANVTTFTVGNLNPNRIQWFTVEAFDATTRGRSSWVSIMTPPDAIAAPTNVQVVAVTQTSVTIGWNFSAGALGYKVFQWDGTRAVELATLSSSTRSFQVNSLAPGQSYYFYVQAFNNNNFASSDWINATTTSQSLQTPANFNLQVLGSNSIQVNWNDVAGENGYRIYGWNTSTSSAYLVTTLSANTTSFNVTGLLPGRTYWFYVQAYNAFGVANTAWASAVTTAAQPLQAPTSVSVVATGTNSATISWVEPARAVGYRVFIWNGLSWSFYSNVAAGTSQASITGLSINRTYWFMVQSYTESFAEYAYSSAVFINM